MFGEDDAMGDRNYTTTVRCLSTMGKVYCIKADEFILRFGKDERTWNIFIDKCREKDKITTNYITQAV